MNIFSTVTLVFMCKDSHIAIYYCLHRSIVVLYGRIVVSELELNNGNLDVIDNYYITKDSDSYVTLSDCLVQTEYRCFQKFSIIVEIDECPNDGLEFDAIESLSITLDHNDTRYILFSNRNGQKYIRVI